MDKFRKKMNKNENFQKLEDFIYNVNEKESRATSTMADIVGVLSGIKPAAFISIPNNANKFELKELFDKNDIKSIFLHHEHIVDDKPKISNDVFISKNLDTAGKLSKGFKDLWGTMDDLGNVFDREKWEKYSFEIGKLLGYPETAIKYFIERKKEEIYEKENVARMARNRYYAHSAENEENEFLEYDQPLNLAVEQWSPRTAKIMKLVTERRWTMEPKEKR